jgi:hypothetical protein
MRYCASERPAASSAAKDREKRMAKRVGGSELREAVQQTREDKGRAVPGAGRERSTS